jgi:phospholipid/cholesterol/gamma-HCH transport system substrate-binding protein
MANPKSIEVKVGILLIVAIGILAGFVLIMGGINFQPTYDLFVDFDNPGGLQTGAPVKIAGVKVGKVSEIQFRGGALNPKTHQRDPLVRLKINVEKRHHSAIHQNATFYVTTQGVLGEQFLAIDPGSLDQPVLPEGSTVRGLDPPRLDMLLAEGYELLHTTIQGLRSNKKEIADTFQGLRDTLKGTGHFFNQNRDRLDRIAANIEQISLDTDELIKAVKSRYVDSAQIARIINNIEHTTAILSRDSEGLIKDVRVTMTNVRRVSDTVGSEEQTKKIRQTLDDVSTIAAKAKLATADAQTIVAHVKKGDGSVGALLMSEQLYDDIQELVRDLKHNPWKLFWKE